jgi:hypothetical protein
MIIIAKYKEDISWIEQINIPYIIYNKGHLIEPLPNVINVENKGRESDTYLQFIISNYQNLPDKIVLCQGDPFGHCKDFLEKVSLINEFEGITYLSDWIVEEDLEGRPYAHGYGMVDMLNALNIPLNVDKFIFPAGAQYIVPKKSILNKSKLWWEKCYECHNNNNLSPWIFERIWPIIFEYDEI